MNIFYIDRITKKREKEKIYGRAFIKLLYGDSGLDRLFSFCFLPLLAYIKIFSYLYGAFQKSSLSKNKIKPFIKEYGIDASEFLESPDSFHSFNDFFIRRLKPSVRPIVSGDNIAILPADARYLAYENIDQVDGFLVKGQKFSLEELLQQRSLVQQYRQGAMVLARLCPVDYHRFHFPTHCTPNESRLINGPLFSVNPIAIKKNIHILSENKRMITELQSKSFGKILYIEVGATHVGSIHQTFTAGQPYAKGDEKGYFSFGGSCLILLFEPSCIQLDQDLLDATRNQIEVKGLLGQSLGKAITQF